MQLPLGWLIVAAAAVALTSVLWPALIGAAWSPTSTGIVRRMLDMAQVGPHDTVYDLGSGDGRIVVEAARRYRARAVGIEADPLRLAISRLAILILGVRSRAKVVWGNFFRENIGEATVVTLFLTQGTNQNLRSKLQGELKKGARVVSYSWSFDEWTPSRVDPGSKVYLYVVGEGEPERK